MVSPFVRGCLPLYRSARPVRPQTAKKAGILFYSSTEVWYKRLEKGRFLMPKLKDGNRVELDRRGLSMLLEGIVPLRMSDRFSL